MTFRRCLDNELPSATRDDLGRPAAVGRSAHPSAPRSELPFDLHDVEGCVVFRPDGDLDVVTVGNLRAALTALSRTRRLVIDLSAATFVDSAGLGALIAGIRRVREHDGDVTVACRQTAVRRMLDTVHFDRLVPVMDTVPAAVRALTTGLGPVGAPRDDEHTRR
ncbi:MAG: STAS domain-containing protein [Acidimicrobiia bacterium]